MTLSSTVAETLRRFRSTSRFTRSGGVITDLDGTALHEREGRLYVHHSVAEGLKALVELGRPVVINTLRFPLNVIRTFGREWGAITANPVPLVSLNGAVVGLLTPVGEADTTFEELAAFPLSVGEIEDAIGRLDELMSHGVENLVVFTYPRDWSEGEIVWTPHEERVPDLRAKYLSATEVFAGPVERLRALLLARGACMLAIQGDVPDDRLMAYQHANPSGFLNTAGIDKLSGAREAAARLDFELSQSVGAGDTPMDSFLCGVGLAVHVGPMALEFEGRQATIRLPDPASLGRALFALAQMEEESVKP